MGPATDTNRARPKTTAQKAGGNAAGTGTSNSNSSKRKRVVLPLNFGRSPRDHSAITAAVKTITSKGGKPPVSNAHKGMAAGSKRKWPTTVANKRAPPTQAARSVDTSAKRPRRSNAKPARNPSNSAPAKQPAQGNAPAKVPANTGDNADRAITSYAIITASSARDRCATCQKGIPMGALVFQRLERANKQVKKRDATVTAWHQNCFAVPTMLLRMPLEQLRGWPDLAEKQQRRIKELIAAGEGATMRAVNEAAEAAKQAAEAAAEEANSKPRKQGTPKKAATTTTAAVVAPIQGTGSHVHFGNTDE